MKCCRILHAIKRQPAHTWMTESLYRILTWSVKFSTMTRNSSNKWRIYFPGWYWNQRKPWISRLTIDATNISGIVCLWNKHFSSSLYFYQQPRKFHLSLRRRRNHLLPLKNYGHRGYEFVSVFLWSKKYNAEVTNSHSSEPPFWQLEEKYMRTNTGWRNAITACHIWTNATLKDAWKRDKKRK